MAIDLVQLIFDQFLGIVERLSKKSCFIFNECDFEFRVREFVSHRLIDVIHTERDHCGRPRNAVVTIDYTSICVEDLTSCRWIDYLKKLAREFISEICPKKLVVVKEENKKCRPQPPKWEPFPCRNITTVIRKKVPIHKEPECKVIIERECECVPQCKREPCIPTEHVIIKYENEKPWKCGDFSMLVENPEEKQHDFKNCKGNKDYNHHQWKKCCGGYDNNNQQKKFYESTVHH
jgi:hypothetical protein